MKFFKWLIKNELLKTQDILSNNIFWVKMKVVCYTADRWSCCSLLALPCMKSQLEIWFWYSSGFAAVFRSSFIAALREGEVKTKLKNGYWRRICEVVLFDIIKRPYIKLGQLLLGNRRWFSSALVTYSSSRRSPTCHLVMPKMREHESLNRGLYSHLVFPINCMENLKTPLERPPH